MTAKERMAIPPQPMPEQDPLVRARNMEEVALGYTAEMAKKEASRCLNCPAKPCVAGCPVKIRIPDFLAAAADGDFAKALAIIRESSLLPAVCGRVCPQEKQCQKFCTVGKMFKDVAKAVAIGRVERFCSDCAAAKSRAGEEDTRPLLNKEFSNSSAPKRVAVIGSGPAGITCAADCARAGLKVTLFEAFHKPGGVLVYGIPEFRLPKRIVANEIENLKSMGVEVVTDFVVGRTMKLSDMLASSGGAVGVRALPTFDASGGAAGVRALPTFDASGGAVGVRALPTFDAVFIGTGAGLPKFMDIEGENLIGVFSANEYLTRANLMKAYPGSDADTPFWHGKKVAVLGGGNVAMDAARMALRLGADEVHLIYRRSEKEMPARAEEVAHAKAEGVVFHTLENAKRILGDERGRVAAIECLRYELGEPDASGRRSPVEIRGSEFTFPVDTVVVAVGNGSNPLIAATTPDLAIDRKGHIVVDEETMMTSIPGVFAGGDIVLGAATVILAMGEGRKAAQGIVKFLGK